MDPQPHLYSLIFRNTLWSIRSWREVGEYTDNFNTHGLSKLKSHLITRNKSKIIHQRKSIRNLFAPTSTPQTNTNNTITWRNATDGVISWKCGYLSWMSVNVTSSLEGAMGRGCGYGPRARVKVLAVRTRLTCSEHVAANTPQLGVRFRFELLVFKLAKNSFKTLEKYR